MEELLDHIDKVLDEVEEARLFDPESRTKYSIDDTKIKQLLHIADRLDEYIVV